MIDLCYWGMIAVVFCIGVIVGYVLACDGEDDPDDWRLKF